MTESMRRSDRIYVRSGSTRGHQGCTGCWSFPTRIKAGIGAGGASWRGRDAGRRQKTAGYYNTI